MTSNTLDAYKKYQKKLVQKGRKRPRKKAPRAHRPERDRAVHAVLRLIKDVPVTELADKTYVSASTIYNWKSLRTRYPMHHTLSAVAEAMGYEYKLVKSNSLAAGIGQMEDEE